MIPAVPTSFPKKLTVLFLLAIQFPPVVHVFIRLWDQALSWFDTAPLWQLGLAALLPSLVVSTAIRRHLAEVSGNPGVDTSVR